MSKHSISPKENLEILFVSFGYALLAFIGWEKNQESLVVFGITLSIFLILGIMVRRQIKLMDKLL